MIPNDSLCIHQLFEEQAMCTPMAIAVTFGNEQLTYQTLNTRANQLAHYLRGLGVVADLPVGLYMESSVDLLVGMLGILKAGGGYVPLDRAYPSDRIAYMIADSQITVLLTQKSLAEQLSDSDLSLVAADTKFSLAAVDTEWDKIANMSQKNPENCSAPETLAYIIYTSGSTGKPKGIEMPHRALVNLIQWQKNATTISRTAKTLQFAPISFDVSFQEIFSTLCSGGTLVMMPPALRRNPKELLLFLADKEIERLFLPPAALQQLAMAAIDSEITLSCLKEVITAGDQLQIIPAIEDFFSSLPHCTLHNHYGPSETHVVTAFTLKGSPATWTRIPSIGKAIANNYTYLLDETLEHVPEGNYGELYIGGMGLARGYVNRPDLTQTKFIQNPYGTGRLYKTGDLARFMPDGNLEFLGRSDNQVKIRGFRIELGEIETLLSQHPMVKQVAVVPYEDGSQNRDGIQKKRLIAYVVPESPANLETMGGTQSEQVDTWQSIWDEAYRSFLDKWANTFHLGGWNDSYTGGSLPEEQIREWVAYTVERIMKLSPRRVLEIGCGTGLLLFRIAPSCSRYYGIDVSEQGLNYIRQQIVSTPLEDIVTLQHAAADAIDNMQIEPVDTIIINGVIQFFPGMDYFIKVIEKALSLLQPGGQIFIGDVQSYHLAELFNTSVQLYQASDKVSVQDLQKRITERMAEEKKLLFSPALFAALSNRFPQISHTEIQLKRGYYQNELTRFRYDVVVHVGKPVKQPDKLLKWSAWHPDRFSFSELRRKLVETAPEFLSISDVPNARLWTDTQAMNFLFCYEPANTKSSNVFSAVPKTAGELRNMLKSGGIEPEAWWALQTELPYNVYLCWSAESNQACYDVLFQRNDSSATVTTDLFPSFKTVADRLKPWSDYANNPLQSKEALVPKLRKFLKQRLPDYMIPSTFVFMDALSVTPSGKVDRRMLPAPKSERPVSEQPFAAPHTATEKKLAEIWSEILNIHPVSRDDNFFDLGGHSLLIMQLLSLIQEAFHTDLPLIAFFENPTIAQLGQIIKAHSDNDQTAALTAMKVSELQAYVKLDMMDSSVEMQQHNRHNQHADSLITSPKRIFLTGATGFIGAFLVDELLRETQADIYCLVRGCKTVIKAKKRIFENLRHYGLNDFIENESLNPRIIPVRGDLSQPLLGLSQSEFDTLAKEVEVIYHLGAEVNLLYPYIAVQAANVQGTQEILRLAGHLRIKPVHYTSTMGIFESSSYVDHPLILENIILDAEDLIYGGYAQSKWVAEQLLKIADEHGIPTTIYRPGAATGHSRTGITDTDHILILLLRYFIQTQSIPVLNMFVDMTPVDYISKAIVHLSLNADNHGKVFHLVNPEPLSFDTLAYSLKELGYNIELTEYSQWLASLREMNIESPDNLFGAVLPILTGSLSKTNLSYMEVSSIGMKFDCINTFKGLADSNISCPLPDTQLMRTYLSYLQSRYKTSLI
ncbi:MAG: amino acid adenylation domain-containing protein [Desulfamplus sp.]|nr:amino acid adenylation domain-containing protein [Desulfamplus sp.]